MTCENCKVGFTEKRRNCHVCGANIGLHDQWFFDEAAGGGAASTFSAKRVAMGAMMRVAKKPFLFISSNL